MSRLQSSSVPGDSRRRPFATTSWSLVLEAADSDSPQSREALQQLCQTYWYPLYAYVRRRGTQPAEAQDLTQAFFAELLENNRLQMADRDRGRFRSFLLASFSHFIANTYRKNNAARRGGAVHTLSIDFHSADRQYIAEPYHNLTPEKIFQRRWAMTLIERSLVALQEQYAAENKGELWEQLKPYLAGQPPAGYQQLAAQLNMSISAVKVAVHRLRRRCQQQLRREIAQTVQNPADIDLELQELFQVMEQPE